MCAAASGADGESVVGVRLAVLGAQQAEDVLSVLRVMLGEAGGRMLAGLGLVEVDHNQPGRAASDADVVRLARPEGG